MLSIPIHFRYRGQRNYVQGSDLLDACIKEVDARHPLASDGFVRLAAHQIVNRQCTLYMTEPGADAHRVEEAYVDFSAQTVDGVVRAFLVPSGEPVSERFPYEEEKIEAACRMEGSQIVLASNTGYSPIEVAIAMNKRLHNTIFPLASERWIFTRIDLNRPFHAQDAQRMRINFLQKLGVKLSRSTIVVGELTIGHIYFSAVPK
jgi:hypothetical protein